MREKRVVCLVGEEYWGKYADWKQERKKEESSGRVITRVAQRGVRELHRLVQVSVSICFKLSPKKYGVSQVQKMGAEMLRSQENGN